jgi:hypothetical protein
MYIGGCKKILKFFIENSNGFIIYVLILLITLNFPLLYFNKNVTACLFDR